MNEVKVSREELLKRIEANRDAHRAVFEATLEKYREAAIAELDGMLAEARAGKQIRRGVSLIEPQDHTGDYDRVIEMLRMEVDPQVTIDEESFAWYVLDDWVWKRQFTTTSAFYGVHA